MHINKTLLTTLVATLMTTTAIAASVGTSAAPTAPSPATVSTPTNQTDTGSTSTEVGSSEDCDVNNGDEVRAELITIVNNMPKRSDIMKNLQENESTKGCLASTKEILDLAATLPTIKGSWGSIGSIIRNRTEQELKNLKNKAIDRACAVADQAIADVMAPIKENVRRINDFSELVSNAPDTIAGKGSDYIGSIGARTSAVLDAEMDRAQSKVNAETSKIVNSLSQGTSVLDNTAMELGFENIGDAAQYGNNIQVSNALAILQNLQSKIPAKPQYTASRSGDGYVKCASGSCRSISLTEYSQIQKQWSDYNAAMNEYGPQIEMANTLYQDALKNSGGSTNSYSTNSYSASNNGVASSTTKLTDTVNTLANQGRDANINLSAPITSGTNSAGSSTTTNNSSSYSIGTQNTTQAPTAPNPFGR